MTRDVLFPTVRGRNLVGETKVLPRDLAGETNLIFVAYHQWQQTDVDSWSSLARQLEATIPGFTFYELPVVGEMNFAQQRMLDYWMRTGIPDHRTRERTITLSIDRATFQQQLGLPDDRDIALLLVDGTDLVCWRGAGAATAVAELNLREVVVNCHTPRAAVQGPASGSGSGVR